MKTALAIIATFLLSNLGGYAQEPISPLISKQFKEDIASFITSRSNSITKEQPEAVDSLYTEATSASPSVFQFSKEEVITLSTGKPLYSDKQISDTFAVLKTRLQGRPAPAIFDFYNQLLDQKKLKPAQGAIFYKFMLHVMPPKAEN